ncbi:hypothetical protein HW130_15945 [Streptomyces sp. PKU-EA00015]|uniref:hypothetical protein n=1 Tax=Streptomyces sp. PKU-EA00015 TaxID=2748326 RepID=UPI0015A4896B|nr:hypothetical protein [Streptomyces sp. PKU-EA00015]NWF27738.1 hypothetical protein [Streptomyces sp. PKU-EA00015]
MTEQITPAAAEAGRETGLVPPAPGVTPSDAEPDGATPAPSAAGPARPQRRLLRAALRWSAAVLICGAVGSGTAFGLIGMERTDVPGLATEDDGRWTYPELSLPALPAGVQRPFTDGNAGEVHHADLRTLLLPAPRGATADGELDGGFVPTDRYLAEYAEDERGDLRQALTDLSVRHIAARGWTMPDGTSSRVYLLRFTSVAYAEAYKDQQLALGVAAGAEPAQGPESELDEAYDAVGKVPMTSVYAYREAKPYGDEHVRHAYVLAGDTLALVVHSRKGTAPAVPFHQTLVLQNQLLG